MTRVWRRSRLRVLCCAKKETAISTGSLWAARLARQTQLELVRLPSVPVARTRAPACLRLGGDLMFSLTVDSSCKAQQARYRLRRALVGPKGPDAIFGKLCGWAGSMNSPYSIAAMRPVN